MAYGGASGKQIATCLGLGWVCAAVATAYNRGHFDRFMEERSMQDSESSLAVINQAQKSKVTKVPMAAPAGAAAAAEAADALLIATEDISHTAHAAGSDSPGGVAVSASTATAATSANSSSSSSSSSSTLNKIRDTLKTGFIAGVNWVQENPKTTIVLCALLYALQYEYRTNRAHEHYEDRLRKAKARRDGASTSKSKDKDDGIARSKTYGGFASSKESSSPSSAAAEEDGNNFPTSTWDARARPSNADADFANIVASLPESALHEFTTSLLNLNFTDATERDWLPELAVRVKQQVLSVAPQQGFKAVLRPGSGNLRFLEVSTGKFHVLHGDILFAHDILQKDVAERRRQAKVAAATDSQ